MRTLESFRSAIAHTASQQLATVYEHMLQAIASHEIANRPNRLEPRQRKRRPKPYHLMTKPRHLARKQEAKKRQNNFSAIQSRDNDSWQLSRSETSRLEARNRTIPARSGGSVRVPGAIPTRCRHTNTAFVPVSLNLAIRVRGAGRFVICVQGTRRTHQCAGSPRSRLWSTDQWLNHVESRKRWASPVRLTTSLLLRRFGAKNVSGSSRVVTQAGEWRLGALAVSEHPHGSHTHISTPPRKRSVTRLTDAIPDCADYERTPC